jgi:bifunctional UDP-N-acetylglucosamine pyrophosphorylase/glucosamine-1-phosphate N-acetyltransferase/UDP-N-acetylglucosamine pyrophosphorylase
VEFVEQTERLGTGHAVKMCLPAMAEHQGSVVVLAGDSPLVQVSSLESLFNEFDRNRPACLLGTLHKENPAGLGRIVRSNDGRFEGIVEEKDATPLQREITEVNMSTYVFEAGELRHALQQLRNENRQKEYYLTDCPGILLREGKDVRALPVLKACESFSINTPDELQIVEAEMQKLGYPSY